jgi:hypothetical protein
MKWRVVIPVPVHGFETGKIPIFTNLLPSMSSTGDQVGVDAGEVEPAVSGFAAGSPDSSS